VISLERLRRPLRVATRSAFYALVVCVVVSCLPVWNTWDAHAADPQSAYHQVFWVEPVNAIFGNCHGTGYYLRHNLAVMAAVAGLAFLVGLIGFRFGPKAKDTEDEPHRLRRLWEPE
jgi:hypothetical protein